MAYKTQVDAREYHKNTGLAEFNCLCCGTVWDEEIRGFYNRWEEDMVKMVQAGEWSQKDAKMSKKRNHPDRLKAIFHRRGRIDVVACHKCRADIIAKMDAKRALGTDGRMYGAGRA